MTSVLGGMKSAQILLSSGVSIRAFCERMYMDNYLTTPQEIKRATRAWAALWVTPSGFSGPGAP